jgi:hypothetical protein
MDRMERTVSRCAVTPYPFLERASLARAPVYFTGRPTHSCGLGTIILATFGCLVSHFLIVSQPKSASLMSAKIPWISARNFLKDAPCSGFVKWSANISAVGQCFIVIVLLATLSLIKKYRMLMCFILLLLDFLRFLSSSIALRLSWKSMDYSTLKPWASTKYIVHIIAGEASSAPTNSDYVELRVLFFCFLDTPMIDPFPSAMVAPV